MAEKKLPVITINRLYAAYGTTVAKILSDRLGFPYYDKDFIKKTVAESEYETSEVEDNGEEKALAYYRSLYKKWKKDRKFNI